MPTFLSNSLIYALLLFIKAHQFAVLDMHQRPICGEVLDREALGLQEALVGDAPLRRIGPF